MRFTQRYVARFLSACAAAFAFCCGCILFRSVLGDAAIVLQCWLCCRPMPLRYRRTSCFCTLCYPVAPCARRRTFQHSASPVKEARWSLRGGCAGCQALTSTSGTRCENTRRCWAVVWPCVHPPLFAVLVLCVGLCVCVLQLPLFKACQAKSPRTVELLINHGADVNACNSVSAFSVQWS